MYFSGRFRAVAMVAVMVGPIAWHALANAAEREDTPTVEATLQSFVDDFAHDDFARPMVFGFEVDGERWHMTVGGDPETGPVTALHPGFPEQPILYWEFSAETLRRLDAGMNGETVTSRARADDPIPLRTKATPGFPRYALNNDLNAFLEALRLHFWTRGRPEILPLGTEHARQSHGRHRAA